MSSPLSTADKVRYAQLARAKHEAAKDAARDAAGAARARMISLGVLCLFTLPALVYAFFYLFPNYPTKLSPSDGAGMQKILFGGDSALVLCENASSISAAGPAAVELGRALKVPSYRLDCSATLGDTGANAFSRLSLHSHWNPLAFIVSKGKLIEQIAPSFTDEDVRSKLAKRLAPKLKLRHTRVDNGVDLDACLNGGSKGCVLAYSAKPRGPAAGELASLVKIAPAVTFALLNAAQRAFKTTNAVLEGAVKDAVVAAKAAGGENGKGTVLIALRRLAPALVGGQSGTLLATVHAGAGPKLVASDIERLLTNQAAAIESVKAAGGAEVDAVSAAAEKEGSALVSRANITIALVVKKASPTPKPASVEGEDEEAPPTEEELAAARERELEVRRRMAEQERDSAHFAAAADDEAESDNGGAASEGGEEEAEAVDLDDGEL